MFVKVGKLFNTLKSKFSPLIWMVETTMNLLLEYWIITRKKVIWLPQITILKSHYICDNLKPSYTLHQFGPGAELSLLDDLTDYWYFYSSWHLFKFVVLVTIKIFFFLVKPLSFNKRTRILKNEFGWPLVWNKMLAISFAWVYQRIMLPSCNYSSIARASPNFLGASSQISKLGPFFFF